jgi:hypothetical protein
MELEHQFGGFLRVEPIGVGRMEGNMGLVKGPTFDIIHRLNLLEDDLLRKISDALQIPEAERGRIISGRIVISGGPTSGRDGSQTPGGSGTQTTSGAGSSQTTPGGSGTQTTPGTGSSQTTPGGSGTQTTPGAGSSQTTPGGSAATSSSGGPLRERK